MAIFLVTTFFAIAEKEGRYFLKVSIPYRLMESKDQIIIEPVSFSTLKESLKVLNKVFGKNPKDKEGYTRAFPASLGDKECLRFY